MKFLSFFMLFALFASAPMAEAQRYNNSGTEMSAKEKRKQAKQEAKQARKEAAQYYKEYMVKKRKALILVKKIEDERSRNASIRSFKLLYEEPEEEDTQMNNGRVIGGGYGGNRGGVSEEAKNKAMEAERKKYEKQIKKIDAQLEAETTRIEEAELMTDELKGYITESLK